RGRSFAMWRHLPGYAARDASGIDLYFRFDLYVEANHIALSGADEADMRALRRRASGLFPPQCHTLWFSIDGAITDEPPTELRLPYTPAPELPGDGCDYNVNPQRWYALELAGTLPWLPAWTQHCVQARDASIGHLRASA